MTFPPRSCEHRFLVFSCPIRTPELGIDDLPEDILVKIFSQLGFATRRTILPLVSKQWNQLTLLSAELWSDVAIARADEEEAFGTLQRSGQTGGIALSNERSLVILRPPAVSWFQRHPAAAVSSLVVDWWSLSPQQGGKITLDLGQA